MALVVGFAAVTMAQTPAQGDDVEAGVGGDVTLTAADGTTVPASGVRLILHCAAEPSERLEISDEAGAFRFERVPPPAVPSPPTFKDFGQRRPPSRPPARQTFGSASRWTRCSPR